MTPSTTRGACVPRRLRRRCSHRLLRMAIRAQLRVHFGAGTLARFYGESSHGAKAGAGWKRDLKNIFLLLKKKIYDKKSSEKMVASYYRVVKQQEVSAVFYYNPQRPFRGKKKLGWRLKTISKLGAERRCGAERVEALVFET